jgi:exodeoxyribonuclease VII large subunit
MLKSSFRTDLIQKINSTQNELNLFNSTFKNSISSILSKSQSQLDLLKSSYEMNHPDKKDKNGFVQISKENKIISIDTISIGDKIELQSPKYIATCTVNNLEKQ